MFHFCVSIVSTVELVINSGALAREARSEAPFFRQIGNPSSRENLVLTSAYEQATK